MKGVLAWVKGHLVVVISVIIAIAALPALLFVSNNMNTALRESVAEEVGSTQRNLQQISVQYNVEALDPSQSGEGFTGTPNEATTRAVKAVLDAHDRDATRVLAAAVERNRAGKTPMLDGLFPAPAPAETTAKRQGAARAWVDAHRRLLERLGAGGAVSEQDMLLLLQARSTQETERLLNTLGVDELSDEDKAKVRETLEEFRLNELRKRAGDVTFYAGMDAFLGVDVPESVDLPTLETIWDWQHRYWVHEDILEAVASANTDPATGLVYQPSERPVRHIVSVQTTAWQYAAADDADAASQNDRRSSRSRRGGDDSRGGGGGGGGTGPLSSEIRPDFTASLTGRAGWPYRANALYDVRYAQVTAIVDGDRIGRFIDAIEADNFMSVVDLDLVAVSPVSGLIQGYAYGAGSLMRAEMTIETLWLRDWTGEFAPDGVREKMGLPARPEPGSEDGAGGDEGDMR